MSGRERKDGEGGNKRRELKELKGMERKGGENKRTGRDESEM